MELSVEPLNVPVHGTDPGENQIVLDAWNEAYERVEYYFLSLGIRNKLLLGSLVLKVLGRASERMEIEADRAPTDLAAEEMDRTLAAWFRHVLGEPEREPVDRLSARGRLALLTSGGNVPWQQYFLSGDPMPREYVRSMRRAYLRVDPDFMFREMRPGPIDLGIVHSASRTIERMGSWRMIGAMTLWLIFIGILVAAFFVSR